MDDQQVKFKQFLAQDYDQLQLLISQLRESGDQEKVDLANQLSEFSREDLLPSEAQQQLYKFGDLLESEQIMHVDDIAQILEEMDQGARVAVFVQIIKAMNDKSRANWDELLSKSPSEFQILYALDAISQLLLKKTPDQLYEETLASMVKTASDQIAELESTASKYDALSSESKLKFEELNEMGYHQLADNLLNVGE